jgi:GH25 family lysozyme M1 (1,4-beta-N-acetylmuramidase)
MTLNVIDIGKDQAGINVAAVPCDAVIVGVCDARVNNPYADQQYQAARRAGKRVGVYQYFRNDPSEADYFVSQIRGYIGQAMIIIDAETDAPNMVAATMEAARRIEASTGVRPVIYAPAYLLNKYDWSPAVRAGYMLWLAAYVAGDQVINGFNPPNGLQPPKWWGSCGMWQFTSTGRLPGWGGNLDLSQVYGTGPAWDAYTRPVTTAQATTVTPIKEATLSAAEVTQITKYIDAAVAKVNAYTAALLLYGYNSGGVQHPGIGMVVEENQRRINTANAGIASPTPAPVALTDAQIQQIITTVPSANLAALKEQFNK